MRNYHYEFSKTYQFSGGVKQNLSIKPFALASATAAIALMGVVTSTTANAANIIDSTYGVGAGSFELGNFINNGGDFMSLAPGDSTTITGWTVGGPGNGIDWLTKPGFNADTGFHSVDLQHLTASSISTSIPTIAGNIYQLSFATATFLGRTSQGLVSAGSLVNQSFAATPSSSLAGQTFTPFTFNFTATGSTTIVSFASTLPNTNYGPVIDSVSVVNAVPEPLTILGAGTAISFGASFKRKLAKKKQQKTHDS